LNQRFHLTRRVRVAFALTAVTAGLATQAHAAGVNVWVTGDSYAEELDLFGGSFFTTTINYQGPGTGTTGWTGNDAFSLALTGSNVYVGDAGAGTIYKYALGSTGASAKFTLPSFTAGMDPQEIALDTSGNLYTADYNGVINGYSSSASSGATGGQIQTLPGARGILVDGSKTYVDVEGAYGSFTLDSFTTGGTGSVTGHTYTEGSTGTTAVTCTSGECGQVRGMAVNGNTLYLADSTWTNGGGQIDEINLTTFALTVLTLSNTTEFDDPNGIALDASGDIYVADYGSGYITEYGSTGTFIED